MAVFLKRMIPFAAKKVMRTSRFAAMFLLSTLLAALASIAADLAPKAKIDPIQANGPIFEGWQKPQVTLLISGELDGYIEPCGCAGLENQLGGLKRRATFIKSLRDKGWPIVALDLGGLVKNPGEQSAIKFRYELQSLVEMKYAAIALGGNDFLLNVDQLAGAIDQNNSIMVSANAGLYGLDESVEMGLTKQYKVVEQGGKRIGVTSILGAKSRDKLKNIADVAVIDPAEGLARAAKELAAEKCDLQVLLVHGDPQEAKALSNKFPQFQIVACTGGAEEPPKQPAKIEGSGAMLVEPGHKGMYIIALGITGEPKQPILYQRVPLDSRFADAP
jgi:2',3'-cyclic-nucleotide 2'-phosphodiesterase (5'-nucleotidase family)